MFARETVSFHCLSLSVNLTSPHGFGRPLGYGVPLSAISSYTPDDRVDPYWGNRASFRETIRGRVMDGASVKMLPKIAQVNWDAPNIFTELES